MTSNYDECKKYANELNSEKVFHELFGTMDADSRPALYVEKAQLDHNLALRGVIAYGLMAIVDAIERGRVR